MRVFFISGGSAPSTGFGNYQFIEDKTVSTKDLSDYTQKVKLITTNLESGVYRIGWTYAWSIDSINYNFLARIQIDDIKTYMLHEQEPQDCAGEFENTGTDQKHRASGFFVESLSGIREIDIDWGSTGPKGVETSIWDSRIELWRIA